MKKLFSLVMAFTAATTMAFAVGTANVTTDCGKTVRLSVTPKTGYEFVEWQNGAGVTVSTANPYDVVASADATYTAILQLKTYTISYAKGTNPGVTGNPASDTKTHFTPIALRDAGAYILAGHHQDGWSVNPDGSSNDHALNESYADEHDLALYPHWAINVYPIHYKPGTGATGTVADTYKTHGVDATLSSDMFSKVGYTQDGWSYSDGGSLAYAMGATYTQNDSTTLYPHWDINVYTITYDGGANGTGTVDPTYQTHGTPANLSSNVFTYEGYHQIGWAKTDGVVSPEYALGAAYAENADVLLYPVWAQNTYHVRFLNYDGSVLLDLVDATAVAHGTAPSYTGATPTKPSDAQYDYTFAGWDPTIVAATADADYTAQFDATVRSYTVTFVDYDGVTPLQSTTEDYGTVPVYAAAEPTRSEIGKTYTFIGWTTNDLDFYDKADALPTVAGDITYKAVYSSSTNTWTITLVADPVEGGTVTGGGLCQYNTDRTITATPAECWRFVQWNDGDTNASRTITMPDSDITYTATFEKIQYTITVVAEGGNGDVTVVEVPAVP